MSRGKMIGLGVAVLVHILLGYAFITGLGIEAIKHLVEPLKTVNIKEEAPPPDEPPPPPPKDVEIPPFVPPPEVTVATDTPPPITIQTQSVAPQPVQPTYVAPAAPAAPAPVAPTGPTSAAQFDPRSLAVSEDDYPAASLRAEEEGVVRVNLSVNDKGKVDNCSVVASSNFPKLDEKTCQIAVRRFRGKPALQNGTPISSTIVKAIRWQINKK